jgi:CRP-like cAMP-binding protein
MDKLLILGNTLVGMVNRRCMISQLRAVEWNRLFVLSEAASIVITESRKMRRMRKPGVYFVKKELKRNYHPLLLPPRRRTLRRTAQIG